MGTVLPANAPAMDQAQVRLVDQGGGLKGVPVRTLAQHVAMREVMQFRIHQGKEPLQRLLVPGEKGGKELSEVR